MPMVRGAALACAWALRSTRRTRSGEVGWSIVTLSLCWSWRRHSLEVTVPRRLSELYLWLATVPLLVMVQVGFSAADLQRSGRENALALLPRLNRA